MVFAHGFGCDQSMWRFVWPAFADEHRIVLFDHVGYGGSDGSAFDRGRYASLDGYARDVVAICDELDLDDVVVRRPLGQRDDRRPRRRPRSPSASPGSSSSGRRRATSTTRATSAASRGRTSTGLLESLESNYLGWSSAMAPVIMGNAGPPRARRGAHEQLLPRRPGDRRARSRARRSSPTTARDLERVRTPSLVLQCSDDAIAPQAVGEYVHEHLPDSRFVLLAATGHCPNLSAPEETVAAIKAFLAE